MRANPRSRPSWQKPAVATAVALVVVAALLSSVLRKESAPDCPLTPAPAGAEGDQMVLLVDRSGSAATGSRQRQQADDIRWVVEQGVAQGVTRFSVASFDGSVDSVRWNGCVDQVSLVPEGQNDHTRAKNTPGLVADVSTEVLDGLGRTGGTGTDIFGAIDQAVRRTDPEAGAVHIVALTDGIGTAGCSRVDHLDQRSNRTIASNVDRCTEAYGGSFAGRSVTILGVGRTQEALATEQVDWLIDLNKQSCEATGADRCAVSTSRGTEL